MQHLKTIKKFNRDFYYSNNSFQFLMAGSIRRQNANNAAGSYTTTLLVTPIEILIHIVSRRFSVSADTDGLQFNSDVTLTLPLLLGMKIMILTAVS